ncbi:MAG TPA: PQQ-binding-like beta-propeller repeat protein [Planctomycetaceae bacterium]|nr:PQQ-binding-like beta-propeller repeat protein [Planctomycetaceae bacterium]
MESCKPYRVAFFLLVLASVANAEDWTQFRGPRGDGIVREAKHPETWDEESNVIWKVALPGRGWSQPVTAKGRVFVTTAESAQEEKPRRGEGGIVRDALDPKQHEYRWLVLCLDAASGNVIWNRTAYEGKPRTGKHRSNTYASETPATDGELLIAYFGMTGISCYDFDGNRLWDKDLGAFPTQAGWGTGSSPVIHADAVFVQCDNDKSSFLVALDKRSGNELWRQARDERSNWSTPYLWKNRLRTELVVTGGKKMRGHDPQTGEVLWEMSATGRTSATAVGNDELLYVDSVDWFTGSPVRLAAVRAGGAGDISLKAGETEGPFIAWSVTYNTYHNTSPLLVDDCLYMLEQHTGIIRCYDARKGKLNYQQRIPEATGSTVSPWTAGGKIYCLDEVGRTSVLESGPKFKLLASNRLDESLFWASAAFTGDRLILRSMENLYCIGERSR